MLLIALPMLWTHLVRHRWAELVAGKKIDLLVPETYHPENDPFFRANTGWPVGQASDYTLSIADGSRVHAQCFGAAGGKVRLRIHRDRWDPDQGLGNAMAHAAFETPLGLIAVGAILFGAASS
ncbi:MAG: hypothetical protein JNK64_25400 [Myxococcales bacterium]|nr:hypothetical protein [Myxococcales bacterium]